MFFFIGKLIMQQLTTLNAATATNTANTVNTPVAQTPATYTYIANLPAVQVPTAYVANIPMLPAPAANVVIAPAVQVPAANTANAPIANTLMLPAPAANVVIAPAVQVPTAYVANAPIANTPMLSAPAANVVIAPAAQVPAANTANAPAKKITKAQAAAQAKADLAATIKHVLATGNALAVKHTNYYDTYITKGNSVLNALLTEIMEYAEIVFASSDAEEIIKAMRNTLKDCYGIKVQKNSNAIAVIVRYITRTNRKNAHVYARAIKLAFDAGKTSAELANFIEENGGVSKIREKNVNAAAVDLKEMQAHGIKFYTLSWLMDLAENNVIATFKVDEKRNVELGEMARGGYFNYMICKSIGNNEYAVIDAVGQVDDKFEEIMCKRFFNYKYSMYARCRGKDKADIEFRRRIKANIDKWNELRKAEGRNLLNKYGYEIQNKKRLYMDSKVFLLN
jgi:hypothetical protein